MKLRTVALLYVINDEIELGAKFSAIYYFSFPFKFSIVSSLFECYVDLVLIRVEELRHEDLRGVNITYTFYRHLIFYCI